MIGHDSQVCVFPIKFSIGFHQNCRLDCIYPVSHFSAASFLILVYVFDRFLELCEGSVHS